tara:strand:+ start:2232 stop:2441 length:210 start_codon:yes stop_codon:yes gene_type:complete
MLAPKGYRVSEVLFLDRVEVLSLFVGQLVLSVGVESALGVASCQVDFAAFRFEVALDHANFDRGCCALH